MTSYAATAKENYEEALRLKNQCEDFLNQKRCYDCDNLDRINGNTCRIYGGVPDEHLYEVTECEEWHFIVPF